MKKLLTLFLILISLSINGQKLRGYVTSQVVFDLKTESVTTNNISGLLLTFERLFADSSDNQFLQIGEITDDGVIYTTYRILEKQFGPESDQYVIYYLAGSFDHYMKFTYYPEGTKSFTLSYALGEYKGKGLYFKSLEGLFLK